MRKVHPQSSWPASWLNAYQFDLQEVYDADARSGYAYAYRSRKEATLDLIRSRLKPGARILDVAAAQGNFSIALTELGYDVTWNDLRADLSEYVKLKHESGDLRFAIGDVFGLGFDSAFDAVLITEVIEHVAHPDQFLMKISRMVRPGGYVIMTTPNGAYLRNTLPKFSECSDPSKFEAVQFKPDSDGHIFLLWPEEVRALGKLAQLEVKEHRLITSPLTNGHLKTGALLRLLPASLVFSLERLARLLPRLLLKRLMVQSAVCYQRVDGVR